MAHRTDFISQVILCSEFSHQETIVQGTGIGAVLYPSRSRSKITQEKVQSAQSITK